MKRALVALLTFTVGVVAFDLLKSTPASSTTTFTTEQKIVEIAEVQVLSNLTQIKESPKPFFDSFQSNENENLGFGGWFIADEFKGMREVWTILLSTDDENSNDEKLIWSAMVLTRNPDGTSNDDDNFQSVWIKAEGNHLSFKTNKIRGIEYKFTGKFFKDGKEFTNDEKVLKGTLQKIVKGKDVAKFTSEFSYHEPVCFH